VKKKRKSKTNSATRVAVSQDPADVRAVPLDQIKADPRAQARVTLDARALLDYEEAMVGGATFPPVVCYEDGDGALWLAAGFHRLEAARRRKRDGWTSWGNEPEVAPAPAEEVTA